MIASCPSSGEACLYLTQLQKIRDVATLDCYEDDIHKGFLGEVATVFNDTLRSAEKSVCTDRYCAIIGNALTSGLLTQGLVQHHMREKEAENISQQNQAKG